MFINPLLLFGLALVSAPVIIHILNKRRYRVHDWAAMDFLLAAQVSNRRRVKFEDLILLLLRMAIIGFLVMAVARPVLRGLAGSKEDTRVVVLDDSFSMGADFGAGKVFKAAQDSVVNQVQDALGGSIPVSVWLGSRPGKAVGKVEGEVRGGVVERDQASEASSDTLASLAAVDLLDSVPELATSDLELDFSRILRRLIDEAENSPVPRVRSVVLVSDYRDRDWFAEDGSLKDSLAVLFEEIVREEKLKNSFNFQFVDVSSGSVDNTALTGFSIESDPVLAGVPARIAVEVTNYGKLPRVRVEGNIEVGGSGGEEFEARHKIPLPLIDSIPAGETVRVEIQHIFTEAGEYHLRASISPDLLARDDESTMVVVVRDSLQVALVDGAPSANRFASESGLLRAALSPRGDVPSGVSTLLVEGEVDGRELAGADCVFILNRSSISSAERDALGDFARSGGGIAYFLGNKVDVNSYLPLARPLAGEPPLFPAVLKEPAPPGALHLGFADFEHPTLELFRGLKTPSFSHVVFRRFFLLDPLAGAKVVGSFDDKLSTAAVIEGRYFLDSAPAGAAPGEAAPGKEKKTSEPEGAAGRGRLVVFNTSADRDWGDWPTDYTYPILMQEWVRYLSRSYSRDRTSQVGGPLRLEEKAGVNYRIVAPPSPGERQSGAAPATWIRPGHGELYTPELAGLFRVSPARYLDGAATESSLWYSVRRVDSESDLTKRDISKLRETFERDFPEIPIAVGGNVDVDAFRRDQEGEIWRWLALAAGLFLLLELFAAWWFGRKV